MSDCSTWLNNCETVIDMTYYYIILYIQARDKVLNNHFRSLYMFLFSCDKRKFVIKKPLSCNGGRRAFTGWAMLLWFGSVRRRRCRRGRRKQFATFKSRTHLAAPPRRIMCKIIASETDRFIVTVLRFGTQ